MSETLPKFKKSNAIAIDGISLLLGMMFGLFGVVSYAKKFVVDLDQAGFTDGTTSVIIPRHDINFHMADLDHIASVKEWLSSHRDRSIVVWLGNSQLHAINQYKDADKNAPTVLFDLLETNGDTLVTVSLPNANIQEHLLSLSALVRNGIVPKTVLIPVVFDDTREDGVRASVKDWFHSNSTSAIECENENQIASWVVSAIGKGKSDSQSAAFKTMQDRSEGQIDQWLSDRSKIWTERGKIRGTMFYHLYTLRNWIFRISPSSVRKRIPATYEKNLVAFDLLLKYCTCLDSQTLVYIPPLRDDVDPPYQKSEYDSFKSDIRERCSKASKVTFVNLEKLVPNNFWGSQRSPDGRDSLELDFMHFQAPGHRLLAEKIFELLSSEPQQ